MQASKPCRDVLSQRHGFNLAYLKSYFKITDNYFRYLIQLATDWTFMNFFAVMMNDISIRRKRSIKVCRYLYDIRGVTLLEIVIVTAIIGIAAELVAHNFISQAPKYRLQRAARQVALDIMEARAHAINRNVSVKVGFQNGSDEYSIWHDSNNNNYKDDGEEKTENIAESYPGIKLEATENEITFSPRGFADDRITVTVSAASGSHAKDKEIGVTLAGTVRVK